MYSYENTYNEKTGEWHPHTYTSSHWWIVGLISKNLPSIGIRLQAIHTLWTFAGRKKKGTGYAGAAAEVCKYALKFGDLSVEHTWEAFKILKGRRLTGSFGLLWGVKIPEKATDDLPDDQSLPYLEMLYKFNYGKHSYYDLIVTRNVEPKAKAELGGGGATTTDRRCEAEALATKDEARTERSGAATQVVESATYRPQQGRKKAHWRIPPATRVRVRQRIRRWDGYLYNIDLFPYVEHRLLAFIEG